MLRPFWGRFIAFDGQFGLLLVLAFGIPRFAIVLNANITGNYSPLSLVFLLMWAAPFIFLTAAGRRSVGLAAPRRPLWLVAALPAGALACLLFFLFARWQNGDSEYNWLVYIARTYPDAATAGAEGTSLRFFLIYAAVAMTFSPVGEELLYRGIVHDSFAASMGEYRASMAESLAFGVTHLAHFGILYRQGAWEFAFFPALHWMAMMFLVSRLFYGFRRLSGSLAGAVIGHAGFNLMMMYLVFYRIY